ncbi:hypothetical protein F5148DRAFT_994260 [Russula earlei]|uniref:Uncharacterized protein n=1 Tax=Russula earlei TaxID=71964 RepID=A0ACC0UJ46_9AGAM|nr:hypothetical protein F5148DRAFT_994260 [Russula earlei]
MKTGMSYRRLAKEMDGFFVGPMPPQTFLDNFLPSRTLEPSGQTFKPGMFSEVYAFKTEVKMYNEFIKIMNDCLNNVAVVNTAHRDGKTPDTRFSFTCRPDCAVYDRSIDHKNKFNSSLTEFAIEFKANPNHSPFINPPSSDNKDSGSTEEVSMMNRSMHGNEAAGQIVAYATLILGAQYRTHTFLVMIAGDHARLIRWDRGGAIVTEPIFYDKVSYLFDFFMRYDHATPESRGHDPTVCPATVYEKKRICGVSGFDDNEHLLSISIPNPHDTEKSTRYIVPAPCPRPDIPIGRWTRATIAYNIETLEPVLLKDSWRVLIDDILPEGNVYEILRQACVPNIAEFMHAYDVGDAAFHESRTHYFAGQYGTSDQKKIQKERMTHHRHYRILLRTIGRELTGFKRSQEMVNAIYDALKAHQAACAAGILHRDISPGNILIVDQVGSDNSRGILIDWDLSKIINPLYGNASTRRRYACTGTWQFMAADLVCNPAIPQTFVHDLESAFWVLIWNAVLYMETNMNDGLRSSFLKKMSPEMFEGTGGTGKSDYMAKGGLEFTVKNKIVNTLLKTLKYALGARHETLEDDILEPSLYLMLSTDREKRVKALKHEAILQYFENALKSTGWPTDDAAIRQTLVLSDQTRYSLGTKRSRSAAE